MDEILFELRSRETTLALSLRSPVSTAAMEFPASDKLVILLNCTRLEGTRVSKLLLRLTVSIGALAGKRDKVDAMAASSNLPSAHETVKVFLLLAVIEQVQEPIETDGHWQLSGFIEEKGVLSVSSQAPVT